MKKTFTFLLLVCITLNLSAQSAVSVSDMKLSGVFSNKLLELVLFDLEIKYRLEFEYEKEKIDGIRISTDFRKSDIDYAMKRILSGTGLWYEVKEGKTIAIFPKSEMPKTDFSSINPTRKDFQLSGTIKDKNSEETLPFANVQIMGTSIGTTTNVDGYFTLFDVPSDTAILQVSYLGYQSSFIRLMPDMDMNKLEILLEDFGLELEEVIVKATEEEQMLSASSGISRVGISPAALDKLPSYGEKDVFRSLQLLPGVSGSNESSSGLYVRGGTPDQNLVLFDGFTVYHVEHLFGFFSAFNANAVKDVQLYKGGFDAKYGGRLSSVVDITGKDGNAKNLNAGVGLSLLSANAFVEAPFAEGKGSFLVAGRRSFQSNFYNNIFDAYTDANEADANVTQGPRGRGQETVQPTTYFYDLNAKVSYRFNKEDIISLSFYNGQDDLDNSRDTDQNAFRRRGGDTDLNFSRESTDLTNWGNWGTSLKWSRRWSDRFYTNANISYSNYYSERDQRTTTTIVREDSTLVLNRGSYEYNDLRDFSFKLDNELNLSQKNQLDFGIHSSYNDIDYSFTQNDTLSILDRQSEGVTTSFYLQDRHTFSEKLIAKGGLRSSYYTPTRKVYFEPRANLTYLLSDKIKLKAAWGKYYQFANRIVREDIQQGSRDFWLLADDESVPISSAFHHIVGLSHETPKWLFDVEAYYKTLDGLSEYSTRFVPSGFGRNRVLEYEEFFFEGDGVAKGIEFLAQRKVGKFTGWASYTLGEVKYDFPEFSDEPFFATQDVTNEIKLVANYKLGRITLGGTAIYATGKPYTAPTGYYELPLLDGSTTYFFEVSEKNALRFDDYHRVDLSATYDFNLGSGKSSLGLSLFNIYNRQNTWYKEYDVIEGELLETDVSLLGFTPSLFFNWSLR